MWSFTETTRQRCVRVCVCASIASRRIDPQVRKPQRKENEII